MQSDGAPGNITLTASSKDMLSSSVTVLKTADGKGSHDPVYKILGSAVAGIEQAILNVAEGDVPTLPAAVRVNYQGGTSAIRPVAWEASVSAAKIAQPGAYRIYGKVDGHRAKSLGDHQCV